MGIEVQYRPTFRNNGNVVLIRFITGKDGSMGQVRACVRACMHGQVVHVLARVCLTCEYLRWSGAHCHRCLRRVAPHHIP